MGGISSISSISSISRRGAPACPPRAEGRAGEERGGFTLTELLVVIAIIMILAATTVPALNAFRRGQRLDHAARLVQSALNDARRRAITKHTRHVVVLYEYEHAADELNRVRHALAVYSAPVGEPNTPGYFAGGYVGDTLQLPVGIRFLPSNMQFRVWQSFDANRPSEPLPLDSTYFRRRNPEALAFRADGTLQPFNDFPGTHPAVGANIYLPDEGYFQVPDTCRADIVMAEVTPTGQEIVTEGKSRRVLIDLMPMTGRSSSAVFDTGGGFETMNQGGGGG